MGMTDRELLELAAKAVGINGTWCQFPGMVERHGLDGAIYDEVECEYWNPLQDDGDALRLVVILRLQVVMHADWVEVLQDGIRMANATSEYFAGCMFETARAAIVRAAAEIHRREVEEQH